jgi:hypothetical protein
MERMDRNDVLQLLGLGLVGSGLFVLFGVGVTLTALGAVLFLLGVFGGKGP